MTKSRHSHELVALDNDIYALGGLSNGFLSSVEKFNGKLQKWSEVSSMLEKRHYFGAVSMTA